MTSARTGGGGGWLWWLVAAGVLTQTSVNLVRPAVSYEAIAQGADPFAIGAISAAFAVAPVAFTLWMGRVAAFPRRLGWLLIAGVAAMVLASLVLFGVRSLWLVGLCSAVLGIGQMAFTVAGQSAVARFSAPERVDSGFGWFTAAFSAGQFSGPVIAGLILGHNPTVSQADLEAAFLVSFSIALAAAPPALIAFRWFARTIRTEPSMADAHAVLPNEQRTLHILRQPTVLTNMLASIALLATVDLLVVFLPLLGTELGIAPSIIGLMLGVRALASILSRTLTGVLTRRLGRNLLVLLSLVVAAAGFLALPLVAVWPWAGLLTMVGAGFFLGLGQPITMSLISQAVSPGARSSALAVRQFGNRVGQLLIPLLGGLVVVPLGAAGPIWLSGALLAGAAAVRLRRRRATG